MIFIIRNTFGGIELIQLSTDFVYFIDLYDGFNGDYYNYGGNGAGEEEMRFSGGD